jgi:hypothetical protein
MIKIAVYSFYAWVTDNFQAVIENKLPESITGFRNQGCAHCAYILNEVLAFLKK